MDRPQPLKVIHTGSYLLKRVAPGLAFPLLIFSVQHFLHVVPSVKPGATSFKSYLGEIFQITLTAPHVRIYPGHGGYPGLWHGPATSVSQFMVGSPARGLRIIVERNTLFYIH